MKNIKNRVLGITLALGLVASFGLVPAHAEWKQTNGNWTYTNSDGTLKTGWLQDNGKWYYLNSLGVMRKGWINPKSDNKWYYLLSDGTLDNSKTSTTMPSDVQGTYNLMHSVLGNNIVLAEYRGQILGASVTSFAKYGLTGTKLTSFFARDIYGNDIGLYLYDPKTCNIYKLQEDYTLAANGTAKPQSSITQDQATTIMENYLKENSIDVTGCERDITQDGNTYNFYYKKSDGRNLAVIQKFCIDKATSMVYDLYQNN